MSIYVIAACVAAVLALLWIPYATYSRKKNWTKGDIEFDVTDLPYAGFFRRFFGVFLDSILISLLALVVAAPAIVVGGVLATVSHSVHHQGLAGTVNLGLQVATYVFAAFYIAVLIAKDGGTLGMRDRSIGVLCVDATTRNRPTWKQSTVRFAASYLVVIVISVLYAIGAHVSTHSGVNPSSTAVVAGIVFGGIPALLSLYLLVDYVVVPLVDKKKRTIHDMLAGTVVLELGKDERKAKTYDRPGQRLLTRCALGLAAVGAVVGAVIGLA